MLHVKKKVMEAIGLPMQCQRLRLDGFELVDSDKFVDKQKKQKNVETGKLEPINQLQVKLEIQGCILLNVFNSK